MATTDIQNSVYKTIDVIVKKRIEDLHLDKTIECIVENCVDLETGKYRVKYGAGFFDAYSINKEVYFPNTAIYVLVPENNFNNKKTIIGKVSSGLPTSSDEETDSLYTDYNIIGKNILVPKTSDEYFKINSTSIQEYQKILYDINTPEENLLTIDTNSLNVYLKETQAFRLSGKFKTNAKTKTGRESFGLTFTFTQKTANTNYKTMQARWEAEAEQAKAFVEVEKDKIEERTLQYYYNIVKNNVFNNMADKSVIAVQNELSEIVSELQLFKTGISKENKDGLELTDLYIQLLSELANYTVNANNNAVTKEDIVSQFNSWFTGISYGYEKKVVSYSLTSNIMTGNPYHYSNTNGSYQYFFVDIDPEKFVSLDQILFYSDFIRDDSNAEEDLWVKDISLECIKYVTNTNEDYRLSLSYSDIYFDESASDDTKITVSAKLIYQDNNDVTQYSRFLWFKKNSNIKSTDLKYNNYGGEGWEHITDSLNTALYDRSPNLDLYVKDNKIYRNQYKVVAMYDSSLPIEQEFTIYNEKHNHDIELTTPSGLYFRKEVNGVKEIICKIDGSDTPPSTDYVFKWFANDIEIKPQAEIKAWRDKISIEKDKNVKNREQAKLNLVGTILWDKEKTPNIIQVPNIIEYSEIEGQVTITCQIFVLDENNQENEFDVISVILKNEESLPVYLKANYVEIENGDQVFQYNEMGISPASARYENPQVPKQLSCKLYDPAGGYIDRLKYYEVSWEVPIENTLIRVDNSLLQTGSSGLKNKVVGEVLNFSIADEYDYNATNNQIICEIKMVQDGQPVPYRQSTNFFFGKVGEDGTNGTDVVAKISPININDTLAKEVLTLNINKTDIDNIKTEWNNGVTTDINANNQDGILQLQLFRNNDLIDPSEYKHVSWSILNNGLTSKHWGTHTILENNSAPKVSLVYKEEKSPRAYTNYVIKGQADLKVNNTENDSEETKYQTYFGFYPICTITQYAADLKYNVGIDKARTLRHIMYNSDGRFPQYNKNLGVGLTFTNKDSNSSKYFGDDTSRTIVWEAHGGIIQGEYQENNPAFSVGRTKTWVPSIKGQTEDKISELEETKKKILTTLIATQKNNCISTDIPATLNNIKTQINNQKVEINKKLNSLKFNINTLWANFKDTQLKKKEAAWDILKSYSGDIDIKSYIYKGEQKYFDDKNKTSFKEYVDDYVEAMLTNDSIRRNPFNNSSIVSPKILTSDWLSFSVKNVSKDVELAFQNLIITITIGYKANLIVYDSAGDSESLLNQVSELEKELEEINKELDNYNSITPEDIAGKIDSENKNPRAEKIKAIIFENDSITDEDGISQTLFNLILQQKEIYSQQTLEASENLDFQINYLKNELDRNADPTFCSVLPNEIYNGEFPNQYVKASIYKDETLEYEVIVPIHMYLNLYGLGLLNSWDGNGIEINNDGEYILAPQIGAGQKNSDNTFTGLLMGTKKESEQNGVIGLFGYNQGRQSIALNSETGSAVFGLPEQQGSLTDGRIELIPGGTSSISQWKVDARSLYNILPSQETDMLRITEDAHITEEPTDERLLGPRYEDAPQFAHGSIPHDKQGILFSALPPYVSFKGRQLNAGDHEQKKVNFLNLNTTAREGDSFELQIDPNDSEFFTLYEHSYRLKYGEVFCDQWKNLKKRSLYDFSDIQIDDIKSQIQANDKTKDYKIVENDYIICQIYYTNNGRQLHVLSLLKFIPGDKKWIPINPAYKDAKTLSDEYVVGELYQYEDWNSSSKSSVWKFITFTDDTQIIKVDKFSLNDADGGNSFDTLTIKEEDIQNKVWRRHRKAGIDSTGKFTAESLGVGSLGMGLGDIKAFNKASYFVGTSLESDNSPIIQFFIDKQSVDAQNGDEGPVYISSSKDLGVDEGKRPIRMYAGAKPAKYNETVFGSDSYKSGIFVGKNSNKNPVKDITKIELWQTSDLNDNNIALSALGNDTKHQSIFALSSNETGRLYHTNNWTTNIDGTLSESINHGQVQKTIDDKNGFKLDIAKKFRLEAGTLNKTAKKLSIDSGDNKEGLTVNYQIQENKANTFILNENSQLDVRRTMKFITRGRSSDEGGNDGTGVLMSAQNTNGGILLRTTAAEQFDGSYSGQALSPGVASLLLHPSAGNNLAPGEFYLQGGPSANSKNDFTRVFSSHEGDYTQSMVVIEPRLDVKSGSTPGPIVAGSLELQKEGESTGDINASGEINADGHVKGVELYAGDKIEYDDDPNGKFYSGMIYGNAAWITNTCDGDGAAPDGGGTITLGSSDGVSITIPEISVVHGRPRFSTDTITIRASEPNSEKWATREWVGENAVGKTQAWPGTTSFTYNEASMQSILNDIAVKLDSLRNALNRGI